MIKRFRGALCASLFFCHCAFATPILLGLSWSTSEQLEAIAALEGSVRYVAQGIAFVEVQQQTVEGFKVLCVDGGAVGDRYYCLLYTSPSPRDRQKSRMPSSA